MNVLLYLALPGIEEVLASSFEISTDLLVLILDLVLLLGELDAVDCEGHPLGQINQSLGVLLVFEKFLDFLVGLDDLQDLELSRDDILHVEGSQPRQEVLTTFE
jgi:hypothetical protein